MRAVWKGTLVLAKVTIPVSLHKAADHDDVEFRSLHRTCGTPVGQHRICPTCNVTLEGMGESVRAFEFAEGQYVQVENSELSAALGGKTLKLDRFVPYAAVPPVHLGSPYWLAPGSDRYARTAYATLLEALRSSELAGMARLTMYSKERVVLVHPLDQDEHTLGLQTVFLADEVRDPKQLKLDDLEVDERAVTLMRRVITARAEEQFEPARLKRWYPRRVPRLLAAKVAGEESIVVPEPTAAAPRDLIAALKKSVPARKRPRAAA